MLHNNYCTRHQLSVIIVVLRHGLCIESISFLKAPATVESDVTISWFTFLIVNGR
jgi:hypothetical protein